jgi:cytidyltransferase-like protein
MLFEMIFLALLEGRRQVKVNRPSKYLGRSKMKVSQLFEAPTERKLLAVIYPGRFQPFHKGHNAAYHQLCKWFKKDNVWIASSDKTTDPGDKDSVSFLDFTERKELMVTMYGLLPDHIVKCKNPAFSPVEILSLYKAPVVTVMAVGSKDAERYKESKLFTPYPMHKGHPAPFASVSKDLTTANEKAGMYYVVIPSQGSGISGTKARELLAKCENQKDAKATMEKVFGEYNADIARMVLSNLKEHV